MTVLSAWELDGKLGLVAYGEPEAMQAIRESHEALRREVQAWRLCYCKPQEPLDSPPGSTSSP